MTMEQIADKYGERPPEVWPTCNSREFLSFSRNLKSAVRQAARSTGARLTHYSVGFYSVEWCMERNGFPVRFRYEHCGNGMDGDSVTASYAGDGKRKFPENRLSLREVEEAFLFLTDRNVPQAM